MKRIVAHLTRCIVRGLIVIAPLALSYLAVRFLYTAIDRPIATLAQKLTHYRIPGLGVVSVLFVLYFLGLVGSNVFGRQVLGMFESVIRHIPGLRAIYNLGKQVGTALSVPQKHGFKRVVLVEYLKPGMWTIGFVTGAMTDRRQKDGEKLLKVFVPTPPNPASGTMIVVRESQVRDPGWTLEEGVRTVVSGGLIGPEEIDL
jgi:uncharacterized membrane protein